MLYIPWCLLKFVWARANLNDSALRFWTANRDIPTCFCTYYNNIISDIIKNIIKLKYQNDFNFDGFDIKSVASY